MNQGPGEVGQQQHPKVDRQIMLLGGASVTVDWLGLFSVLPPEYRSEWHPLLFVPIEFETEWPRWEHSLHEAIGNQGSQLNMQAHGAHVLLTPHDNARLSRLFLMPGRWNTDDHAIPGLIIFADGDPLQDWIWVGCVWSATSRLTRDLIEFPWKAAIGPFPHQNMGGESTRLSLGAPVRIGEMTIESLNECVVDRSFSRQYPSLSGRVHAESWPLSVSGIAFGYERRALQEMVTRELVLLSAVFSLATGIPWKVRELPFTYGDNEIHISKAFYGPNEPNEQQGPIVFEMPNWAEESYRFAKINEDYRNALLMYSESLQLESSHPSITLIAYMACLQSLGRLLERNREKQLRAILRTVRDEEKVNRTLRYYGHRSETAHRGVLWGTEDIAHSGGIKFNPFVETELPFWSVLWDVKEALVDAFAWVLQHRPDLV